MKTRALRLAAVLLAAGPALAQSPEPIGVDSCDEFLAAYDRCARHPAVPEAVRPSVLGGIETMRRSFREAIAANDRARATIAHSCRQAHATVRPRMVEAFGCDFPGPALPFAETPAAPPRSARSEARRAPPDDAEARDEAKANAYAAAQNHIVRFHPLSRNLAEFRRNNERILRPGFRPTPESWFSFGIGSFDVALDMLKAAIARVGSVPEVDGPAARLVAALEELNGDVKALERHQSTREFRQDGFRYVRERAGPFMARMEAAIRAADAFGDALIEREVARDERRLASLPPDALPARLLVVSLAVRRAARRFEALGPKADAAPFTASLAELSKVNGELASALDALRPRADPSCGSYVQDVNSLIGHGRDVARDLSRGSDPSNPAERFGDYHNRSVENLAACRRDEERAR